jgi:hypothetical protein
MRPERHSRIDVRTLIWAGLGACAAGLVAVLLSGAASAALFAATPPAIDTLALSSQDQPIAWNDLSSAPSENGPADFRPGTTSAIPSTVQVRAIKGEAASDVPALSAYDFAKVQNKLLIINPRDMMIAEVISG